MRLDWKLLPTLIAAALLAKSQSFDVASVKLYHDSGIGPRDSHSIYTPKGVEFRGRPLGFLIGEAYEFVGGRIVGPNSLTKEALWPALTTGYDIVAKTDHPVSRAEL